MTRGYLFQVGAEARSFCDEIVDAMIRIHGISETEAVARVNRQWMGNDFKKDDIRYHETDEFWANDIYYGPDSHWWLKPPNLKPLPYP